MTSSARLYGLARHPCWSWYAPSRLWRSISSDRLQFKRGHHLLLRFNHPCGLDYHRALECDQFPSCLLFASSSVVSRISARSLLTYEVVIEHFMKKDWHSTRYVNSWLCLKLVSPFYSSYQSCYFKGIGLPLAPSLLISEPWCLAMVNCSRQEMLSHELIPCYWSFWQLRIVWTVDQAHQMSPVWSLADS